MNGLVASSVALRQARSLGKKQLVWEAAEATSDPRSLAQAMSA